MKESIVLIGAGGHARACIDVIEAEGRYAIAGLIDTPEKVGSRILGHRVIGADADLERLATQYRHFLVAVGHIKTASLRVDLFAALRALAVSLPVVISPTAYVSKHASLGDGTIVMHRAVVNAQARIGQNCIINSGAIVEHDVTIGNSCHISTAAVLNGGCTVGDATFVGSHATIREGIRIGPAVVIGAHSCAIRDCESCGTYVGVPARMKEK